MWLYQWIQRATCQSTSRRSRQELQPTSVVNKPMVDSHREFCPEPHRRCRSSRRSRASSSSPVRATDAPEGFSDPPAWSRGRTPICGTHALPICGRPVIGMSATVAHGHERDVTLLGMSVRALMGIRVRSRPIGLMSEGMATRSQPWRCQRRRGSPHCGAVALTERNMQTAADVGPAS